MLFINCQTPNTEAYHFAITRPPSHQYHTRSDTKRSINMTTTTQRVQLPLVPTPNNTLD